jgi:chemotaxis family two-component system response regulator Rcp1
MNRTAEILLVEDNPADVRLLQDAFKASQLPHRLQVVSDGLQALSVLQGRSPDARAVRPDLLMLELHLPGKTGWEVLAELKATPVLHTLPVIMLSGGLTAYDEAQRRALRPDLHLQKPQGLAAYFRLACTLGEFWPAFSRLNHSPTRVVGSNGRSAGINR